MMPTIQCDLQNVIKVLCNKVSIFVVIWSRMTFTVIGTATLKLRISQLIKDVHAGRPAYCPGMMGVHVCVQRKWTQSCVAHSFLYCYCASVCAWIRVYMVMCESHLLLKGCYMPGEHTLILSVVCLPLTGALLTLTHKDMLVCVFVTETERDARLCVCVWSSVCLASNLCFGFFNFKPHLGWAGGPVSVTWCWELLPKRDLYSRPLQICFWEASMATVWCSPGGLGELYLFLFNNVLLIAPILNMSKYKGPIISRFVFRENGHIWIFLVFPMQFMQSANKVKNILRHQKFLYVAK